MFRRGEGDERHEQGPIQPTEVRMKEQASGGPEVTVVGKGARLEGNLVSAGSLRIDGQVKGKITAEGDVSLSPQSDVDAEIRAANVIVAGKFKGNIMATNRTELSRGGSVDGNVNTKVLVVAEGASFTGQSVMDGRTATSTEAPATAGATAGEPPTGGGTTTSATPEPERARTRGG